MAKTTSAGVFQLPNGMWGFRYAFMLNGKQKDIRRNKDENGNPFKTERAAIKYLSRINKVFTQIAYQGNIKPLAYGKGSQFYFL